MIIDYQNGYSMI